MSRLAIFFTIALALLPPLAHADPIDDIALAELRRQQIPGLSIAVVKDGKIVKESGYGIANLEHDVPVTPATVFQSGSVGKQFTAALTMLLVADGKIVLDAPVATYLPGAPSSWSKMTVRHLLTHTSGMITFDESINLHQDFSDEELLQRIFKLPLESAPGEKWSYSNPGYQTLGILCTKVGGKFYGEQMRERLFKPSGMNTRIISDRDIVPHRAAGYDHHDGVWTNQDWVAATLNTTGDGSLYLTAHDLALWSLVLDGDKVLSKPIKTALWTPATLNDGTVTEYGFGWFIHSQNGHRLIHHDGAWQGFTSHISRYADDRFTVIVLANLSKTRLHLIAEKIAAHYIPGLEETAKP